MCYRHLSDTTLFSNLDNKDLPTIVQHKLYKFAEKYKSNLTNNKYNFITKCCHKISNFYILSKLHKSKEINKIIEILWD